MSDLFNLEGKTALVTGCSRGIGLAITAALAEAGADIIGVSASLAPGGSEAERMVLAQGRRFTGFRADLTQREAVYQLITDLRSTGRPIDILVNNAGIILRQPAVLHSDDAWDRVL